MYCPHCYKIVKVDYTHLPPPLPPPPAPSPFSHDPLPSKRRSMRLLNLLSSSPENPQVECTLEVVNFNLQSGATRMIEKDYEALSWCWGTAKPTSYISIRKNGRIYAKKVQPDLLAALKALRDPQEDRCLWIDAICINQDDLSEKNHQVEMMSKIYGEAKRVCIWLGEGDKSSETAIQFISEDEASPKWGALLELMQRKWFSRRWVVQEIALAQDAMIYCGPDKISWKDFAVAVELFVEVETATHRLSEVMKKDPTFYHVPGWFDYVSELGASLLVEATGKLFRDSKQNGAASISPRNNVRLEKTPAKPLLSLEFLVSSLSIFDVTMEHDTIYALLAIAKDTTPLASDPQMYHVQTASALEVGIQRKSYTVAYESSYDDVCQTFVEFCIRQSDPTRALDIICRPWASEQKPRARNDFYKDRPPPVPEKELRPLPSWISQLSGAPYAMYAHPGVHALKMGRKNADFLVGLPNSLQRNYNAAETKGVDLKALKFRKREMDGHNAHFSMYVKGFVLDKIKKVEPASQSGAIPEEWVNAVGWKFKDSDPPDDFWRTLVADRGRDGKNPPVYYSRACKESFQKGGLVSGAVSTSDLINNERCSIIAQYCRRVQAVIWNRSLIKTESENIGLVGKHVRENDLICILYGCSVPVVLRMSEPKTEIELLKEMEEDFMTTLATCQRRCKQRLKRKFEHKRRTKDVDMGSPAPPQNSPQTFDRDEFLARVKQHIKAQMARTPEASTHYRFLGEAYIHGMMDGEAMAFQNTKERKPTIFELR